MGRKNACYCKSGQEPMARELIGNRCALTNIILLNEHSFKLLLKYVSHSHTLVKLTELTYQRSLFVQLKAGNTETLLLTTKVQAINVCGALSYKRDTCPSKTKKGSQKGMERLEELEDGENCDEDRVFWAQQNNPQITAAVDPCLRLTQDQESQYESWRSQ